MINPVQYGLCLSRMVGGSRLEDTDLRGAHLRDANFRGADLVMTNLTRANLRGANLTWAYMLGADLRKADLWGAIKWEKEAPTLVCALAKVGAPWECIDWEWRGWDWGKPREYDHWVGIAKLYMLGGEDD